MEEKGRMFSDHPGTVDRDTQAGKERIRWLGTTENHFIEGDNLHTDSTDKKILYEILLKSEFTPTTPVIEKKIADKKVYSIDNDTLLICLEHDLTKDLIVKMADIKSVHAKCIYTGFKSNEHIRTTALEIMKSHGVENFRTVWGEGIWWLENQ